VRDAIADDARLEGAIKTARVVAHELNNKLSLITGYGELLVETADGDVSRVASVMLEAAFDSADIVDRLQRLIRFEEVGTPVGPMLDLGRSAEHSVKS
jgi:hypothetical protein